MTDEETKQEETKEEEPVKVPDVVTSANAAAERLKQENERMEKNIKYLEQLQAFKTLGGESQGAPQEKPNEEVTPEKIKKEMDNLGW